MPVNMAILVLVAFLRFIPLAYTIKTLILGNCYSF